MYNQQPWYYSWPVIILAFIFFWPVGILLIFLKSKNSSKQSVFVGSTNKKRYIIIGAILILGGLSTIGESALFGLFMLVGGIILILYAGKMAKRGVRNRKYIDMIVNQRETSIEKIASVCNVRYDIAVKELNQLQMLGVLKNAIINEGTRTIEMPQAPQISQTMQQFQGGFDVFNTFVQADNNVPVETVVVACPGCGAKVTLQKGSTATCEYCDTPISS